MLTFLALLVVWLGGIALALRAIHDGRTSQGTIAWVILLLAVPFIAIPLYLMLGDRRLDGYVRARRRGRRRLDELYRLTLAALAPSARVPTEPDLQVLARLSGLPWTADNTVEVFTRAERMYESLLASIAAARRSIVLQFFIYRDDRVGIALRDALREASARGVKVFLMYDEIGCLNLNAAYFASLREAGVQVSGFRTIPSRRRPFRLNFRNHRKLVVIDSREAYFGGMNIGEEYCGRDEAIGHWRDTHVRAVGPAALSVQLIFAEDWNWAQGGLPDGLAWELANSVDAAPPANDIRPSNTHLVGRTLVFPSGPTDDQEAGVLLFVQLINHATRRLWIATPYFVCEESILHAILLARLRGVDVRILIPSKPDKWWVYQAALSFVRDVVAHGIPVYRYAAGFTHQKVILCDDLASIGSANLDHRSMRLNFELTGIMDDPAFADRILAMLQRDMHDAPTVPAEWWASLTSLERFKIRLARLASPLL